MISEGNVEAAVETASTPRHIALVRITHWIVVLSVLGLLVSGTGILVSHPRLYWGETGAVGTPSLIDLPIPFIIGPSVEPTFSFLFSLGSGFDSPDLRVRHLHHATLPQDSAAAAIRRP